jgi:DNA-binding PadR family transcriptional regulator
MSMEEEVEETLYELIDLGLIEASHVDEDGKFLYTLTEKGKKKAASWNTPPSGV